MLAQWARIRSQGSGSDLSFMLCRTDGVAGYGASCVCAGCRSSRHNFERNM